MKKLGVGFSLGKKTEKNYSYFTQLFHLCDDIAADALVATCEQLDAVYLGSVSRSAQETLVKQLAMRGVTFEHYFREKPADHIFAWDFINCGVTKKYLRRMFENARDLASNGRDPEWREGYNNKIGSCRHGCGGCGSCDTEVYPPTKLRSLWKDEEADVKLVDVKVIDQTSVVQKVRMRVYVEPHYRFIPNITWQFIMRRAAFVAGLPITKRSIRFASDPVKWKNWVGGVDYCEFGLTKKLDVSPTVLVDIATSLNLRLVEHGITVQSVSLLAPDKSDVVTLTDCVLYEIPIDVPAPTVQRVITDFHAATFWEVVMKEEVYRAGIQRKRLNLKDFVRDAWVVRREHQTLLRVMVRGTASPFDVLRSFFNMRESDAVKHVAVRVEVFREIIESHADFFACECVECGDTIPQTLLDKSFDANLCPVCLDAASGTVIARRAFGA